MIDGHDGNVNFAANTYSWTNVDELIGVLRNWCYETLSLELPEALELYYPVGENAYEWESIPSFVDRKKIFEHSYNNKNYQMNIFRLAAPGNLVSFLFFISEIIYPNENFLMPNPFMLTIYTQQIF